MFLVLLRFCLYFHDYQVTIWSEFDDGRLLFKETVLCEKKTFLTVILCFVIVMIQARRFFLAFFTIYEDSRL